MPDSLEACTVEAVDGVDITKLPLAPLEGFVLSRVDRRMPVSEVSALTGLPPEQLTEALEKLATLGALRVFDPTGSQRAAAAPQPSAKRPPPPPPPSATRGAAQPAPPPPTTAGAAKPPPVPKPSQAEEREGAPARATATRSFPPPDPDARQPRQRPPSDRPRREGRVLSGTHPAATTKAPLYDPKLLEEDIDLPLQRRKDVLELEYRLKECTHYEALGVDSGASRKEIRAAYFALSKAFHPDTMFRKELGSYQARMELVFKGITEAYDVLSKKRSRADYDAYLEATAATAKSERKLRESVQLEALSIDQIEEEAVEAASASAAGPEAIPAVTVPEPSAPTAHGRSLTRRSVAARIGRTIAASRGSTPPPAGGASASVPPAGPQGGEGDRDTRLRDLAQSLRGSRPVAPVALLEQRARASEEAGDISGAQEHLRQAISLAPGRQDLQAEHTRLSARLADQLASDYEQQAELEEKNGKWAEAAISWSRVFAGRPKDAHAARRTAIAMLRAGGDMRRAHHFAREAVLLAPKDVHSRIALGQVMMQIGLAKGAKRELQAALTLDPANEMVKNLLAELQG